VPPHPGLLLHFKWKRGSKTPGLSASIELGQLGTDAVDHLCQAAAVLHEVDAHRVVVRLGARVVEHHHHVRLDGYARIETAREGVLQDVADAALAFARPVVICVLLRRIPRRILYMDMNDMIADLCPEFPRILLRPRLWLHAVRVEHGVRRVEEPFQTGRIFEQLQRVLPAHAAVVHAVLMHGRDAGIKEAPGHFAHALKDHGGNLIFGIAGLEAHDANKLRARLLNARDAARDFIERDLERRVHGLRPVHDGGAEAANTNACVSQIAQSRVEGLVRDVVEIRLGKSGHFHPAHLQMLPAQFLRGTNLRGYAIACLVADARENHMR